MEPIKGGLHKLENIYLNTQHKFSFSCFLVLPFSFVVVRFWSFGDRGKASVSSSPEAVFDCARLLLLVIISLKTYVCWSLVHLLEGTNLFKKSVSYVPRWSSLCVVSFELRLNFGVTILFILYFNFLSNFFILYLIHLFVIYVLYFLTRKIIITTENNQDVGHSSRSARSRSMQPRTIITFSFQFLKFVSLSTGMELILASIVEAEAIFESRTK